MKQIKSAALAVAHSAVVRADVKDLVKVVVGVVLAHFGLKYS